MENLNFSWTDDSIRFINTATPKARQTFFYVQEAGDFSTFPPYFTERENLNSFLLIYTLSGKGLLKYQNNTFTLFPGSLAYIDCMNHHYYECLKKDVYKRQAPDLPRHEKHPEYRTKTLLQAPSWERPVFS